MRCDPRICFCCIQTRFWDFVIKIVKDELTLRREAGVHNDPDARDFVFFRPFFILRLRELPVIAKYLTDCCVTGHFISFAVQITACAFAKRTLDADMLLNSGIFENPDFISDRKLGIVRLLNHNSFLRNLSV